MRNTIAARHRLRGDGGEGVQGVLPRWGTASQFPKQTDSLGVRAVTPKGGSCQAAWGWYAAGEEPVVAGSAPVPQEAGATGDPAAADRRGGSHETLLHKPRLVIQIRQRFPSIVIRRGRRPGPA